MRKIEKRASMCIALAAVLFLGIVIFGWRFVTKGDQWASFYGNTQIFSGGAINRGTVYDRNGVLLLDCTKDGMKYNEDGEIRRATAHAVGDPKGNISTGAINVWRSQLIGYDILNGTYDTTAEGKKMKLTIDSEANRAAYSALGGRQGTVGVMNYKTGEIVCMVSTPTVDPANETAEEGSSAYFNTFLMGALTPGSTFKLVTSAAAYDNLANISDFSFTCDRINHFQGEDITCVYNHGTVDFVSALAVSCNGAYGELTREVGSDTMTKYVDKLGLTSPVNVNGIKTAAGSFKFPKDNDVALSWAGIGQYEDLVNPCSMLVYMGAIANDGKAVEPSLLKSANFLKKFVGGKSLGNYLEKDTARKIREMMKNNVVETYGESSFPGLDIYAKSGTAEVGGGNTDAWFVGFIDNDNAPYAFVSWVKNGDTGSGTAGPVARAALDALVN